MKRFKIVARVVVGIVIEAENVAEAKEKFFEIPENVIREKASDSDSPYYISDVFETDEEVTEHA